MLNLYKNEDWKDVDINNEKQKIPTSWDCKNLDSLGFLGRGKSKHRPRNDPKLFGDKYPFVQTAEVKEAKLWLTNRAHKYYSDFGLKQSKLWDEGTLCITIAANIAESSILTYKACFPDSVLGFIANKETNTVFVKYQIDILKNKMQNSAKGSAQDNLNLDKINLFKLAIPKIEEQEKIVSILTAQELVISKIQKLILNIEKRNKFMMDELFSGRLRIKLDNNTPVFYTNNDNNWKSININDKEINIPKDWETIILNDTFSQKAKSKIKAGNGKREGLYPFYNCSEQQTLYTDTFLVDEEVLFLSTGGKSAIHYNTNKSSYSTDVWAISFKDKFSNKFIYYYLKNFPEILDRCFKGSGLKHLNKKDFCDTKIFQPNIDEQSMIIQVLDNLNNEKFKYENILEQEEKKFTFLLDELMSGRLRVKV